MAISNTSILIKRSLTTGKPSSLNAGEFAYSYASNTLFIGTPGGTGVVNVGGQYYTSTIDAATNNGTASTLVKRDVNGAFYGTLFGNSNTASALLTAQNFSISGGDITASAQSFQGNNAVTLSASLNSIPGLTAGYYGGTTAIPVVQVAANGRIMSISNTAISTSFTVSGNTGSGTQNAAGTLTVVGVNGSGINTIVYGSGGSETIAINTDTTIARTNVTGSAQVFNTDVNLPTNNMSVGGTLTVNNLVISGNVTEYTANTLSVNDPIIYLAANNTGNAVDIGLVGHLVGQGHSGGFNGYQHTGFVRDYNDNKWKLFSNVIVEPSTTVTFDANTWYDTIKVGGVDVSNGSITNVSTLSSTQANTTSDLGVGGNAYIVGSLKAASLSLTTALGVSSGGTNNNSFTSGQLTYFDGTKIASLANTGTAGTYGSSSYVPIVTTDAYGRVSGVSNTAIAIDASAITTGTLPIARGGTNGTTYTAGQILQYNGSSFVSLANVSSFNTSISANNTVNNITVDSYGRVTNYTTQAISGLTVPQGGTGLSSATLNGIVFGNGAGNLGVTAVAGSSDQTWSNQILTVTNVGVPVWASAMDGGTF